MKYKNDALIKYGFLVLMLLLSTVFLPVCAEEIDVTPGMSIQDNINNATEGDTILVHSGIYQENIVVDKKISLIGYDSGSGYPVIDGFNNKSCIHVKENEAIIEKLVLINSSSSNCYGLLSSADDCTFREIEVRDNYFGICLGPGTKNNILINSNIYDNAQSGIKIDRSSSNQITRNNISDNFYGIIIFKGSSNLIYDNIFNNKYHDVSFTGSYENKWNITPLIKENIIGGPITAGNYYGKGVGGQTSESMHDVNNDGICDSKLTLDHESLNIDYMPLHSYEPKPPLPVENLKNITYESKSIEWTWEEPNDPYLDYILINFSGSDSKENIPTGIQYYKADNLNPDTEYTIGIFTVNKNGDFSETEVFNTSKTSPDYLLTGLINLTSVSSGYTWINWTWEEPVDPDYSHVMIFSEDSLLDIILKGNKTYNMTGLMPSTEYSIKTQTVDKNGILNETWTNANAKTLTDLTLLGTVSNLSVQDTGYYHINWTWEDPVDDEFVEVIITHNNQEIARVGKGIEFFQKSGLLPNVSYEISTSTIDIFGVENKSFINSTGITKADNIPPMGVSEILNESAGQDYIEWTWINPTDPDLKEINIRIGGKNYTVSGDVNRLKTDGLIPDTEYVISFVTVDTSGNQNQTPQYGKGITYSDKTVLTGVENLRNISCTDNSICWNWTDPNDPEFTQILIYINGESRGSVAKGICNYTATGLLPDTEYTIGTCTTDKYGLINETIINDTARTKPAENTISPIKSSGGGGRRSNLSYIQSTVEEKTSTDQTEISYDSIVESQEPESSQPELPKSSNNQPVQTEEDFTFAYINLLLIFTILFIVVVLIIYLIKR